MRIHGAPVRALIGLLAVLAFPAAAHAALTDCSDINHHGYLATGIREQGMGCAEAHGMVRHIIEHGPTRLHHFTCNASGLPHGVTLWNCSRTLEGAEIKVEFGVRVPPPPKPAFDTTFRPCEAISHHGYEATAIREYGFACSNASLIIRHVIQHGASGFTKFRCESSGDPVTWSCRTRTGPPAAVTWTLHRLRS